MTALLTWRDVLTDVKQSDTFKTTIARVQAERAKGKTIYPAETDVFNAFRLTEYHQVKVVILGQDPYHGPNQAHGLAFSVKRGEKIPPSLLNIYKEIVADIGGTMPSHGYLRNWAQQGVLLINNVLTVEANQPNSHKNFGWQAFTDAIIRKLNTHPHPIVYLLWGAAAQQKVPLIDERHTILTAPHPSPLSAHRGFLGCRHFSQTNDILIKNGQSPIDWLRLD